MILLLRNVIHPDLPEEMDILIVDGQVDAIGKDISYGHEVREVNLNGKFVTDGWLDLHSDFSDPGFEYREDIWSGSQLAAASGYTDICVLPYTNPVLDGKGAIKYFQQKNEATIASIHPVANVSKKGEGKDLAEMFDLWESGASYFMDIAPIENAELLLKALQYAQRFGGVVATRPLDPGLAKYGHVHEGFVSTSLGLKGVPRIAEVIALKRDLEVLKYAGGRLHVSGVSAAESVELLKEAKNEGLQVTADVAIHSLMFTDAEIRPFDTAFKTDPVIREETDRQALLSGLASDVIDAISSYHLPRSSEEKNLEFDLADFGITSLQTVFPSILKLSEQVDLKKLIHKLTDGPRSVLGYKPSKLEVGEVARLAIFDKEETWTFNTSNNLSKSTNSPFWEMELKGKCLGVINGDKTNLMIDV